MKKHMSKKKDFQYILIGLFTVAMGQAILEAIALFKENDFWGWLNILICVIGWAAISLGMYKVRPKRKEFKKGFVISICGGVCILISALLAFKDGRSGLEEGIFLGLMVMFFKYLSDLAILAIYFLMTKGLSQLMAKNGNGEDGIKRMKFAKVAIAVIFITLVTISFSHILSTVGKLILGGISIGASLFMEFKMLSNFKKSIKQI